MADINTTISILHKFNIDSLTVPHQKIIAAHNGFREEEFKTRLGQEGVTTRRNTRSSTYPLPDATLLFNNDTAGIETMLAELHRLINTEGTRYPRYKGLDAVNDVYEYLAFFTNETAQYWKDEPIDYLRAKFIQLGAEHGSNTSIIAQCKNIDAYCEGTLLPNEAARVKYNNYIELKRSGLIADLELCRDALPIKYLQSRGFVDNVLKRMIKGWSREQQIEVYNHLMFDKAADYYEDYDSLITVNCPNCNKVHYFQTENEAHAAKCCGSNLYVNCPNCEELIPSYAEYCPSCSYFIPGRKNYEIYCDQCLDAINRCSLTEARRLLNAAELACPNASSNSSKLNNLKNAYNELYKKIGNSINELEKLVSDGLYHQAKVKYSEIHSKFPMADISKIEKLINDTLNSVNTALTEIESGKLNDADAMTRCLNLSYTVKDDPRIEAWLMQHEPQPIHNLKATINNANRSCTIRWDDPDNVAVTYTIIRCKNNLPQSHTDGEIVVQDTYDKAYTDQGLESGTVYYYAVYAMRAKVKSKLVSHSSPLLITQELDLNYLNYEIQGDACNLSWKLPANCIGVRVMRKGPGDNGLVSLTKVNAPKSNYSDMDITQGDTYTYRFRTLWSIPGINQTKESDGIKKTIRMLRKPDTINLSYTISDSDNSTCIKWSSSGNIPANGKLICLNGATIPEKGKLYTQSEYKAFGNYVSALRKSTTGDINLRSEPGFKRYTAFNFFDNDSSAAGEAIAGDTIEINTLMPPTLNGNECKLEVNSTDGKILFVKFDTIPIGAKFVAVYLFQGDNAPINRQYENLSDNEKVFAEPNSTKLFFRDQGNCIYLFDIRNIRDDKTVSIRGINLTGEFKIIAYSVHAADGNRYVFSSPSVTIGGFNIEKIAVTCEIDWYTTFFGKKKSAIACLKTEVSPTPRSPKARIVANSDGSIPYESDNKKTIVLGEFDEGHPYSTYIKIEETQLAKIPQNAPIRIYAADGDDRYFNIKQLTEKR